MARPSAATVALVLLLALLLLASSSLSVVADAAFIPPAPAAAAPAASRRATTVAMAASRQQQSMDPPLASLVPRSWRLFLPLLLGVGGPALTTAATPAFAADTATTTAVQAPKEPTEAQLQAVRDAFKAFDGRDLRKAERLFDRSVEAWEQLARPRDELAALLKARGNVRCDLKAFKPAIEDYDRVLELMASDGTNPDGTAAYVEYPDTFVQRGLAFEGLGEWEKAVQDYGRAIQLWGGGRGPDVNPFVLSYRGNSLARLGRYEEALKDYKASADLFLATRDEGDALFARANQALALYETGAKEEAVKMMKDIVRRSPGFVDGHAALAASAWGRGDLGEAETQWRVACDETTTGCRSYRDLDWVGRIRRWPPSLVKELDSFLSQKRSGGVLAR